MSRYDNLITWEGRTFAVYEDDGEAVVEVFVYSRINGPDAYFVIYRGPQEGVTAAIREYGS